MGEYNILDVQWKEGRIYGKPCRIISGQMTYNGTLQLLLDRRPSLSDFTFKRYGRILFAELDGFVRVFKHEPGTHDGFAGSEFILRFDDGTVQAFKGSLWDPISVRDVECVPEYRSASITTEKEVMERGHTFYASYVTKALYDDLMELVKALQVGSSPT